MIFLFYNLPLLKELEKEKDVFAARFVDEIAILVEEKSYEENSAVFFNLHKKFANRGLAVMAASLPPKNTN